MSEDITDEDIEAEEEAVKEVNRILNEKKFVFTCTNRECKCLREGIGIYFTTDDIEEAEKHSRENNSPMWIARKEDLRNAVENK